MKTFLNAGCGYTTKENTYGFHTNDWQEIRMDIDKRFKPDIIGSITNMENVPTKSVDAVFSSHNIEHIHYSEVVPALKEFFRVLKPDGFLVITCPDLMSVAHEIIKGNLDTNVYQSSGGPVSPIDMIYGWTKMTKEMPFMEHKCGFTLQTMSQLLKKAQFEGGVGKVYKYALWMIATKNPKNEKEMLELSQNYMPT